MSESARGTYAGSWQERFSLNSALDVLGTAFVLKRGAQPALESAKKGLPRLRTASAEMAERVQDIYAEAEAEYAAETLMQDDTEPPPTT